MARDSRWSPIEIASLFGVANSIMPPGLSVQIYFNQTSQSWIAEFSNGEVFCEFFPDDLKNRVQQYMNDWMYKSVVQHEYEPEPEGDES